MQRQLRHRRGHGPGTYLHRAILRWTGQRPQLGCDCKKRIDAMNRWGPAGCRKRLPLILKWLRQEARRRKWWRYAVTIPGSQFFLKQLVLNAIKESEDARREEGVRSQESEVRSQERARRARLKKGRLYFASFIAAENSFAPANRSPTFPTRIWP